MQLNLKSFRFFERAHDKLIASGSLPLLLLAALIGLLGGFGAIGFRALIELFQHLILGGEGPVLDRVMALPWYVALLLPAVGGLVVGPLVYYVGRESKGHGVPEVMQSVALGGGRIRSRVMFLTAFASALTIATGGSVGREGPIVQIGSSLGSSIGQLCKVNTRTLKLLVGCGAAAGIAATFNAPVAGVLFAVEVILGNYAIGTLLPLMMSSVIATMVGRWYSGDVPAFVIPSYPLNSAWEIGPYLLMGVLAGVVAVVFVGVLTTLESLADRVPLSVWVKTPLLILPVGVMIVQFPQLYGVGYDTITQVLKGDMVWFLLLALVPMKMLATSTTLAAGGSGGVFAPSLFLGAVFGGLFGAGMQALFPGVVPNYGAYAVVGMSAVLAGTTHAPITAFMVIFEMTANYSLILPLMLCTVLASFTAILIKRHSIYTIKLFRRGIELSRGMEVSIMQARKVRDVMTTDMLVLNESTGFDDLLERVISTNQPYYYVTDDQGRCQGSFCINDIKEIIGEEALAGVVVARDLTSLDPEAAVVRQDSLADCMARFSHHDVEELPVIDDREHGRLVGRVSRRDILKVYDREILSQGALGMKFIQSRTFEETPAQNYVDLPDGYGTRQVPVAAFWLGHTLKDLDVRGRFGVSVVAISRKCPHGQRQVVIPEPGKPFKKGDLLVVIGKVEQIDALHREMAD